MSYHTEPYHIISYRIISHHIIPYRILSSRIISYYIIADMSYCIILILAHAALECRSRDMASALAFPAWYLTCMNVGACRN